MKRQKESKVTKILMLILSLVFFTSTIVASSISKYVTQKQAYFGDKEHLDYTVNSVFVVRNQEELFAAINQGYTYVQLDQDIENPLIVTQKAETLNTDLILDLNGIEIQRNGYEPILNIKPGVRLTVVDTSSEQTGGLYNPVGSVFNIYGGTLTVVAGNFESGPRYSEYYSYNNYVLDGSNDSQTKRTLVEDAPKLANFYEKDASTGRFKPAEVKNLPIIKSYPEKTGNVEYNHGNLYFDERVAIPGSDLVIEPDTYCYYRTSEDASVDTSADSMADWYYTYYVSKDNFTYLRHDGNEEDHIKITIFGYYNTIKQASEITDPAKYYAAIQMTSGTLDVQNGTFNQYFGVDTTACVNAQGGDINIKKGKFSSRVPNATYYTKYGKGTKEVDTVCFTSSYFDNYKWNDATTNYISGSYNGRLAKVGESYCILNGGSANVTIGTGDLYSSNNNIISMGGGALSISGGDFTKRVTNGINVADGELTEMAAINMQDGTLDISSATCSVFGDSSAGILMQKGKLTVEQTQFDLQGNVINGIYSLINNDTDFQVLNSSFTLNGNNAVGIYSKYGKVNISADTSALLSIEGDNSYGIYVKNSGSVASDNYSYELNGDNSIGILAESDATGINVTNGSMNIVGSNTFGIKSSIVGDGKFTVKNLPITMTGGDTQTGIFAENGSVQVSADNPAEISTSGITGRGIHVKNGGSVISTNYSYSLSGAESIGILADSDATGINVTSGSMNIVGSNTFGIKSSIVGDGKFTVKNLPITMTGGDTQTGIFAENGSVQVSADNPAEISTSGTTGRGIHVENGGSVASDNYSYELNGDNSIGILAESDATGINVTSGSMNIVGSNTFGIKSSIVGDGKFTVKNLPITMTGGDTQTGIFAENGSVQVSADNPAEISTSGITGRGIHVENGGSVISTNYSYSLSGAESIGIDAESGAKGINVTNGEMNIQGNNSFGINSSISGIDTFNVKDLPITMTNGTQQTGIFAQNGRVNVSAEKATISINDAYGKGIHVGAGGSVFSDNYSYELKGIRSYGIYSTAGTVSVTGGDITLDSNDQCYGVYAFSASEKIKVDIDGAEISVGYGITNNKTSDTRASVGVFLATNDNTNKITLTDTNIRCYEVGVLIDGGSLDVKSTTATPNEILTRKASSIIVKGGSVNFDESCNYNITSSTTVNNSATNVFNITLPTVDEAVNEGYNNYDGIYVDGGNLTSNGNVDITHTGLYNDTPSSYDYNTLVVKSYAVRILGGNVNILKGNITALIGGGIYSGASGALIGDITMGNKSSALSDITVKANGNSAGDTYNALGTTDISESWRSNKSITGGHAIELNGGNISVYNGTYEAQFGNGVAANSSGRIEIYNGIFNGWMNANGSALDGKTGPSAFYGLKVVGGAQVVIKGGTFDGGNGGAFVTGVTEVTNRKITKTSTATVLIYAGTFGSTRANLWDAFNIYDDAIVVFGAGDSNYFSTVSEFNNSIKLLSGKTSIAVNRITQYTSQKTAYIYVHYGDYSGGNMWNDGNGDYKTYNTRLDYTSVTGVIGEMNNNTAVFNTITI